MTDNPRVKAQSRRQLSMLLPINGRKIEAKVTGCSSKEAARETLMDQLERAGLRETRRVD